MLISEDFLKEYRTNKPVPYFNKGAFHKDEDLLFIPEKNYTFVERMFGEQNKKWSPFCVNTDPLEVMVFLCFQRAMPILSKERNWYLLRQQANGTSCSQFYFCGTPIKVRESVYNVLLKAAENRAPYGILEWDCGHSCNANRSWDQEIEIYRKELEVCSLKYDTDDFITESIYPFDATNENIKFLTDEVSSLKEFGLNNEELIKDVKPVFYAVSKNSD